MSLIICECPVIKNSEQVVFYHIEESWNNQRKLLAHRTAETRYHARLILTKDDKLMDFVSATSVNIFQTNS